MTISKQHTGFEFLPDWDVADPAFAFSFIGNPNDKKGGTLPPPPVPTAPSNLAVSGTGLYNANLVTWTGIRGATSYNLYAGNSSGTLSLIATGISTQGYVEDRIAGGTARFYAVTAVVGSAESAKSSVVSATPNTPLATYYISAAGSGTAPGTSPATPWNLTKLNTYLAASSGAAGDCYLFNRGDTFSTPLHVQDLTPTSAHPICLGTYGTGAMPLFTATGANNAIFLDNVPYVGVACLNLQGAGVTFTPPHTSSSASTVAALQITNSGSSILGGFTVAGCLITNAAEGIQVGTNGHGYSNFVIAANTLHDNWLFNMLAYQATGTGVHTNPTITGNNSFNCYGDSTGLNDPNSGYPFALFGATGGTINNNYAGTSGQCCVIGTEGGPVGIIIALSSGVTVSGNEIDREFSPSGIDGTGIDVEQSCTGCTISNNWIHGCDGAGLEFDNATCLNNLWVNNIIENCGNANTQGYGSAISDIGSKGANGNAFINNTFSCSYTGSGATNLIFVQGGVTLANNIFRIRNGATFGNFNAGQVDSTLINNAYDADTFALTFYNGVYTSLANMQAQNYNGFEFLTAQSAHYGVQGTLALVNPGNGTQQMPLSPVTDLTAYDPLAGCLTNNIGVNTGPLLGVAMSSTDYHGNPTFVDSQSDIGAVKNQFGPTIVAFQNGSFESPQIAVNSFDVVTAFNGWFSAANFGVASNGSAFGNINAQQGDQVALIQFTNFVSQVFSSTGGSKTLSFYGVQRPANATFNSLSVTINGAVVATGIQPPTNNSWTQETVAVTLNNGNNTITFTGLNPNGGDNTVFVDNVTFS